jgi:hypothetical protein
MKNSSNMIIYLLFGYLILLYVYFRERFSAVIPPYAPHDPTINEQRVAYCEQELSSTDDIDLNETLSGYRPKKFMSL